MITYHHPPKDNTVMRMADGGYSFQAASAARTVFRLSLRYYFTGYPHRGRGFLREATRRDEQEDANWGYCFSLARWSRLTDNYCIDGCLQANQ